MNTPNGLTIHQGDEFSTTAYRRLGTNNDIINPIPSGFQARMKFAPRFDSVSSTLTLTSSPAAGLTINNANGSIAIYIGATQTVSLVPGVQLQWTLEMYDPAHADTVVFLGSGTATVKPKLP